MRPEAYFFWNFYQYVNLENLNFRGGGGVASDTLAPSRSPHALLYVLDVNTYVHICVLYIQFLYVLRTVPISSRRFFHTLVLIFHESCIINGWKILFNYFCKFINLYPHLHCLVTQYIIDIKSLRNVCSIVFSLFIHMKT